MGITEYIPYGDLLGYLRKSRGLQDTYYKDPDIKPQSSLTPKQLFRFAWDIANGMEFLSSQKVTCAYMHYYHDSHEFKIEMSKLISHTLPMCGIFCKPPTTYGHFNSMTQVHDSFFCGF